MKKLLILAVAILIALSQFSGTALAARPSYPWNSNQPYAIQTGQARHHIIPWQQLVNFGTNQYTTQQQLEDFLKNYNLIDKANLGSYQNINELVTAYFAKASDAVETVEELFTWMQGNLVVGPKNRTNDPGENFDTPALNCRQHYFPNVAYNDLQNKWNNGTGAQSKQVFETLSTTAMSAIQTATAKAPPPQPECKW